MVAGSGQGVPRAASPRQGWLQVPEPCLVLGRETRGSGSETETWIGMPCRVRLDIYLVGYGREGGEGEEQRETDREREERRKRRERETERQRMERQKLCLQEGDRKGMYFISKEHP